MATYLLLFLFSVYKFCTSPLRDEGWEYVWLGKNKEGERGKVEVREGMLEGGMEG